MAEWQAELWVTGDAEEEFPVTSGEGQLVLRWAAEWNATEHERASIEGKLLLAVFSFLADETNGLELFEPALGDTDGRQGGLNGGEGRMP